MLAWCLKFPEIESSNILPTIPHSTLSSEIYWNGFTKRPNNTDGLRQPQNESWQREEAEQTSQNPEETAWQRRHAEQCTMGHKIRKNCRHSGERWQSACEVQSPQDRQSATALGHTYHRMGELAGLDSRQRFLWIAIPLPAMCVFSNPPAFDGMSSQTCQDS